MPDHVIAIIGLVLVFAVATFTSVHMGALAIVAAFVIGSGFVGRSADDIFGGFPGDLFVVLVGVTFLFAIANNNGTVNWLVQSATRAVGGRIALIPWVMFLVTAVLTATGAVVPAAVGIIAPIGMGFCVRYRINPVLMGLLIINGASAGGFSPISIFGSITNGVVSRNELAGNPTLLFVSSFLFNVVLSLVVFFLFGGRSLMGRRAEDTQNATESGDGEGGSLVTAGAPAGSGEKPGKETDGGTGATAVKGGGAPAPVTAPSGAGGTTAVEEEEEAAQLTGIRALTLLGLVGMVVGTLFFDLDPGLMALTVGVVLTLVNPASAKGAVDACAWSTVLLVCGIVTFVTMMEDMGTIDFLGDSVAGINAPLLAALLICFIGAVVSAFASTTGILGALIPLAVPFLQGGHVGAVGMIIALAVSSSVVDSSPFSTSGALVTANAPAEQREMVFKKLMIWGFSMVAVAPPVTWLLFVIPGWL
ncbi:SLC13 family permease [Streptomyces sp. WMMB 322]|uniref:SLC13 family permease n=1 Tax=Streptomyces sp. WMMB 322 TaxID=1286821 RepID=UPI0006E22997|nr:SLC13 family permease [Streptomyces sp. WMMB 322]SCK44278.1 transporter, UIT1 family (TC 9.B.48) [Streptomyces sp. WMMB 322]